MDLPINTPPPTFKEKFEVKLAEFEQQNLGSQRKPWTTERILEVINNVRKARQSMISKQARTSMDYYWISKYDTMVTANEVFLIFKRKSPDDPTLRIIPRNEYFGTLEDIHKACGHGGRDKMLHAIKSRYYIPRKAIEIFLALCPTCETKKALPKKDSMPLQQRLNTLVGNNLPQQEDNKPPPLKSQPLSPTKLKVTRQSSSKSIPEAASQPDNSSNEEVCLRWNSHHSNMQSAFPSLLSKEQYCDVTLVAEGKSLKCHKLILSSCSSYFDQVLENIMPYHHPVILIKDIPFSILKSLCDFMYAGEVNILQGDLNLLLEVAESLKIKGLAHKMPPNIPDHLSSTDSKETKEPHHQQQKIKETSSSRFVKIAPKPSGVQKFDLPKGGANGDVTDPLDLMEPTYEEEATVDMPPQLTQKKIETARRSLAKRVRKRKHIGDEDHESSPPVFRSRKGTRSRPNVRVPRYFNASFDNSNEKPASSETSEHQHDAGIDPCAEPLLELLEEIKTEPVDIEDSLIEESYDTVRSTSSRLLETIVIKQEKEDDDDPDPLNVEAGDDSQHRLSEENAKEPENSELCNRMKNTESSYNVDNSETSELMENFESNDLAKKSQSEDLENPIVLICNEMTSPEQVPLEYSTTENIANPEENSQVTLSISGTFSTTEELPESDQT